MSLREQIQEDLDFIFEDIGEPAQYNGQDIVVCNFREVGLHDVGDHIRYEARVRVRKTDVDKPAFGKDVLTINGRDWIVYDTEYSNAVWHDLLLFTEVAPQINDPRTMY